MVMAEGNHALHLCQNLARRGLDVHLLTTRGAVSEGLPFKVYPIMRDWSWRDLPRFMRFVRHCSPDAVLMIYIGFIYNDHPMTTFAPTICKWVLPRIPFVVQFENVMGAPPDRWPVSTRLVRKLIKQWIGPEGVDYGFGTLLRDSDGVIALCERHESQLVTLFPSIKQKCVVIPAPTMMKVCDEANGEPRKAGRKLLNLRSNEFTLVYYGYIYPNKGLETLLRGFKLVRNGGCNIRLVIAGGVPAHLREERVAYLAELKELARTLGVGNDVIWTGQCDWDSDEASLYLHAADVCVLPFDDGISMNNSTFAAAALHGRPIIATRGSMLERIFLDGENVFLCAPRNPEALAGAINTLMERAELRERLGLGALKLSEEWFCWDKAIERTMGTLSTEWEISNCTTFSQAQRSQRQT